jgi:hypothetical protein
VPVDVAARLAQHRGPVYLLRNTIENLTTQDAQVACFRNAAAQLEPGGCLVIKVEVPALQRLPPGETIRACAATPTHLGFDEYDIATQVLISHHHWVQDGKCDDVSAVPPRLAIRARPDGAAGGADPAPTLQRLES